MLLAPSRADDGLDSDYFQRDCLCLIFCVQFDLVLSAIPQISVAAAAADLVEIKSRLNRRDVKLHC